MYSVIIPSMGRIDFLNDLLKSIYEQTISPKEIIILLDKNNFCQENAKDINKKDICRIIFCDKLNLPQKRNYGALISNSDYLIFSDDDDIWEINKGELTIKSLKNSQVVCHEYSKFGNFYQNPKFIIGKRKKLINIMYLLFGSNIFGGGSAIASLKQIVLAIPFNENYAFCEDYEWWIKIILAEIKIEYLPVSLVKYRSHEKNMTSKYLKIFTYNFKIYNKVIYKSIILFLTYFIGTSRSIVSFIIKSIKLISLKLINK
tara:strand:+ start:125 stop:901 length:777 start_codon:yes stop_codon:yes gene_type:complete